jgi:hypothetical protein
MRYAFRKLLIARSRMSFLSIATAATISKVSDRGAARAGATWRRCR